MNIDKITNKAYDFFNELRNTKLAWLKAEIWYTVNYEMVTSLSDFFIRRTGMIFFYIKEIFIMEQRTKAKLYFAN